jgi:hypothetical protein
MSDYLCARGTVINGLPRGSAGIYAVEGLESKKGDYPLLITGISWDKRDLLLPVACLNGVKVIYSFGEGFGQVLVRGQILLGPQVGQGSTSHLQGLIDWFQSKRSAKGKRPVKLSILRSGAVRAYLNSLQIADADPQFHVQNFALGGVLVE